MTDKEIRALIEKRRKDWRYGNSVEAKYKAEECKDILELIDSLQEDPKPKKCMFTLEEFTEEDRKVLCENCDDDCEYAKKVKPVSEDLEDFALQYAGHHAPYDDCMQEIEDAFKAGAKWQKEQFEKNRLKHCDSITEEQYNLEQGFVDQHLDKNNRIPTFLDAIEYGMNLQKQQMMTNATEVTVHIDAGGYPYIPQMELYDYDKDIPLAKEGDKYKVVLIKEE